jgi:hypothetical protein
MKIGGRVDAGTLASFLHGPSFFEANSKQTVRVVRVRFQQVDGSDQVVAMDDPGFAGLRRMACSRSGITSSVDPA